MDSVDRYGLDPAINIPVHGIVTSFADTIDAIEAQVGRAREFCAAAAADGWVPGGCPVKYSREGRP
jgi:hypothetical protein